MNIEGIGNGLETAHLRSYSRNVAQQAFDLKMKMTAYWNIVLMRLVDTMASHIQFAIHKLVTNEMEEEIVAGLVEPKGGGGIERMVLDECPEVAEKRHQLTVGLCGGLFVGPAQLCVALVFSPIYRGLVLVICTTSEIRKSSCCSRGLGKPNHVKFLCVVCVPFLSFLVDYLCVLCV
ncbi:unnamed protein product [Cuscuta campestris]|uniref:Dynamin GTPase effector domain-containing protein n=1 Tax=Cuscuta campestris TaxID=132261 RepID=A0A484NNK0_9ASTE|nr:unnamed protein product [Cuscuta campestris]